MIAAESLQHLKPFADRLDPRQIEAIPTVSQPSGAAERCIAVAAHNHRDLAFSDGLWVDAHRREGDELTIERRDVIAPQHSHRGHVFGGARSASRKGHTESGALLP